MSSELVPDKYRIHLWVDALRSGNFQQGYGRLRVGDVYCCLGVACEVAIANGLKLRRAIAPNNDVAYDGGPLPETKGMGGSTMTLPRAAVAWYGLRDANPILADPSDLTPAEATRIEDVYGLDDMTGAYTAVAFNDTLEADFNRIADLIETYYLRNESRGA